MIPFRIDKGSPCRVLLLDTSIHNYFTCKCIAYCDNCMIYVTVRVHEGMQELVQGSKRTRKSNFIICK